MSVVAVVLIGIAAVVVLGIGWAAIDLKKVSSVQDEMVNSFFGDEPFSNPLDVLKK